MTQRGGGRSNVAELGGALTEQQQSWAAYFAVFPNATAAAIRAGYAPKFAGVRGHENSHHPGISALVEKIRGAMTEAMSATPERTVREIACIAYADATAVAQVLDGFAFIADTANLHPLIRPAVASIHQARDGLRLKMHDKVAALRLLAEIQGILKPQGTPMVPVHVTINGVVLDAPGEREPEAKSVEFTPSEPITDDVRQNVGDPLLTDLNDGKNRDGINLRNNPAPIIQPPPAAVARMEAEKTAARSARPIDTGPLIIAKPPPFKFPGDK